MSIVHNLYRCDKHTLIDTCICHHTCLCLPSTNIIFIFLTFELKFEKNMSLSSQPHCLIQFCFCHLVLAFPQITNYMLPVLLISAVNGLMAE